MSANERLKDLKDGIDQELKLVEKSTANSGSVTRREFLQWMGAVVALMGTEACTRQPEEAILPYTRMPEDVIPGRPLFYATALERNGYGIGVVVESHMGRPTKVEGNELHPASLGSTDVFSQGAIYEMYDPDRTKVIENGGRIYSWAQFQNQLDVILAEQSSKQGSGLRILTGNVTSPSVFSQIEKVKAKFPKSQWYQYEPLHRDSARLGSRQAFSGIVDSIYHFDKAMRVVSFDCDFLYSLPGSVRYARDFMASRHIEKGKTDWNRLYMVESGCSLTGASADHRLATRHVDVSRVAAAIANRMGLSQVAAPRLQPKEEKFVKALVADVKQFKGTSVFVAGDHQKPAVHALCHMLNNLMGNVDKTVSYIQPVDANPVIHTEQIQQLVKEMDMGVVDCLVMIGGDPVYNSPGDLDFSKALKKVKHKIHHTLYKNDTSAESQWIVPMAHTLETWGDIRSYDGTVTLQQPLIAPLYQGKSALELLSVMVGVDAKSYQILQDAWKKKRPTGFEAFWKKTLNDGVVPGTASEIRRPGLTGRASLDLVAAVQEAENKIEVVLTADHSIWDGRYANNGWLQELPKPFSKLTWDNAASLSPDLARKLHVKREDIIQIRRGNTTIEAPVWIVPSQPSDTIGLTFGYGRKKGGVNAVKKGVDIYPLRTSESQWVLYATEVRKVGGHWELASTQPSNELAPGRELTLSGTIQEFEKNPHFLHEHPLPEDAKTTNQTSPTLRKADNQWGMAINLSTCIGCGTCTIACMSENNIAIVGKDQVRRGRDMHWIRVDVYYDGAEGSSRTHFQPVPCMHCETAPCELVCPATATMHSDEGLNEMIYNRCIGTKYCLNNCPYKVRRFNFYQYTDAESTQFKLGRNPDVSVRSRGVMEKCTYCVQRINQARIAADRENRKIQDGEIVTACQAACPTQAIVFGDVADTTTKVSQWKAIPVNYGMLQELGTRPRTSYLAQLKNPNPELEN